MQQVSGEACCCCCCCSAPCRYHRHAVVVGDGAPTRTSGSKASCRRSTGYFHPPAGAGAGLVTRCTVEYDQVGGVAARTMQAYLRTNSTRASYKDFSKNKPTLINKEGSWIVGLSLVFESRRDGHSKAINRHIAISISKYIDIFRCIVDIVLFFFLRASLVSIQTIARGIPILRYIDIISAISRK